MERISGAREGLHTCASRVVSLWGLRKGEFLFHGLDRPLARRSTFGIRKSSKRPRTVLFT
ncbi:hypothetical protein BDY21DRAFT_350431 [Lineolata rhizophorae]|uniref:Uncharacterized protein n=1 Tax=Lineolata rhizophorae TaxID=578093 RepID=A0A6A6NU67_9PEZI|nr:hypothetical protein BDY21DRAFT_350431 [Lineolata rhizophorae]